MVLCFWKKGVIFYPLFFNVITNVKVLLKSYKHFFIITFFRILLLYLSK